MEGFADFLLLSGCVGFAAAFAGGGVILDAGAGEGFATSAFFAGAEAGFIAPDFDASFALGAAGFFAAGRSFFTGFFAFTAGLRTSFLAIFFVVFLTGLRTGFFAALAIFLTGFLAALGFAFRFFFTLATDFFSFALAEGFAFTGFFAFFADLGAGFFAMSCNLSKVLKRKSNGVK